MNINFYYRNKDAGFSIGAVFDTIVEEIKKLHNITRTFLPSPFASLSSIIRNGYYAKKKERKGYINHITGDIHYLLWFLKGKKTVVTVHDIMYYHYLHGIKKYIWKLLYITPLKRAAQISFISEFAYNQVNEVIELDKNKVHIIPNPVDSAFKYSVKEFNVDKPVILHIGTFERKNLNRTIEALRGISCNLRIIGKLDNKTIDLLNTNHIEYSNSFDLSHDEIVEEYKKADIINFPSLFEGFGMPIIEGQATGRVVITSNISPMKEVAGKGAVLVNPYSIEEIKEAYQTVIENKGIREQLIKEGKKNVENYKVENISKKYSELYRMIYEENN